MDIFLLRFAYIGTEYHSFVAAEHKDLKDQLVNFLRLLLEWARTGYIHCRLTRGSFIR